MGMYLYIFAAIWTTAVCNRTGVGLDSFSRLESMRIRKNNDNQLLQQLFPHVPPGQRMPAHVCKVNRSPWDIPKGDPFINYSRLLPPVSKAPAPEPPHPCESVKIVSLNKGDFNSADHMSVEKAKKPHEIIVIDDDDEEEEADVEIVDEMKQGSEEFRYHINKWEHKNKGKKTIKGLKYLRRGKKRASAKPVEEEEEPTVQPRRSRRILRLAGSTSKSNEFYYYSGFGPTWDKSTRSNARGGEIENEREDNKMEIPLVVLDDESPENDETKVLAVEATENVQECNADGKKDCDSYESMDEDDYYWLNGTEKPLKPAIRSNRRSVGRRKRVVEFEKES